MAAIKKHPQEIKKVALSIRNAASAIAPRDTGNLRNVLRSYNTPERMITYKSKGEVDIKFFFAPPGATYGKYWNSPYGTGNGTTATIKKRYPKHFDYAAKAMKDPEIKASIKSYAMALGVQVATELRESVRKK
jgi:4-hydroxyphenylpyruvate dioxygenase-like putative hemolysin